MERLRCCDTGLYERITDRVMRLGAEIASGNWEILGRPVDLREKIDWHRDPLSDYRWPRTFYGDLPLYDLPAKQRFESLMD